MEWKQYEERTLEQVSVYATCNVDNHGAGGFGEGARDWPPPIWLATMMVATNMVATMVDATNMTVATMVDWGSWLSFGTHGWN